MAETPEYQLKETVVYRHAESGEFTNKEYAEKNQSTTVKEVITMDPEKVLEAALKYIPESDREEFLLDVDAVKVAE